MKITKTIAEKIVISGIEHQDDIAVYLEDLGPGIGKMTITCFDEAWSHFWGAMGECTIKEFVLSCDNHYLSKKFSPDLKQYINDTDLLAVDCKKKIIEMRKICDLTEDEARDFYDSVDAFQNDIINHHDVLYRIYGDEWWCCLPKQKNHEYERFSDILDVIKQALRQEEHVCNYDQHGVCKCGTILRL